MQHDEFGENGGSMDGNDEAGNEREPQDDVEEDPSGGPGPEREADGETHQDAGLDGGGAQAAQGEDERVGDGD